MILTSFFFLQSFAGTAVSGGGASILCDRKNQLYDLYEGQIRNNYTYPDITTDPAAFVSRSINQMTDIPVRMALKNAFQIVLSGMQYLPDGTEISPPQDLGHQVAIVVPSGCKLISTGFFEESGALTVSREAIGGMDQLNLAAFLFHETVYLAARQTSAEPDSYRSRKAIAAFFSKETTGAAKEWFLKDLLLRKPPFRSLFNIAGELNRPGGRVRIESVGADWANVGCFDGKGGFGGVRTISKFEYDISQCTYVSFQPFFGAKEIQKWKLLNEKDEVLFESEANFLNFSECFHYEGKLCTDPVRYNVLLNPKGA